MKKVVSGIGVVLLAINLLWIVSRNLEEGQESYSLEKQSGPLKKGTFARFNHILSSAYELVFILSDYQYEIPIKISKTKFYNLAPFQGYKQSKIEVFTNLSYGKKTFCLKEDYTNEMMEFLADKGDFKREILHRKKRKITEKVVIGNQVYIVKRHGVKGFFKNLFTMSRGVHIWNRAHKIKSFEIPVFTPVALVEKRTWNQSESFVLYKMRGKEAAKNKQMLDRAIPSILTMLKKMVCHNIIHPDFRPNNLILHENGSVSMIDIDHLSIYPSYSYVYQQRVKEMVAFFQKNAKKIHRVD